MSVKSQIEELQDYVGTLMVNTDKFTNSREKEMELQKSLTQIQYKINDLITTIVGEECF